MGVRVRMRENAARRAAFVQWMMMGGSIPTCYGEGRLRRLAARFSLPLNRDWLGFIAGKVGQYGRATSWPFS